MKSRDSPGGELHRRDLIGRQALAGFSRERRYVHFARGVAVDYLEAA